MSTGFDGRARLAKAIALDLLLAIPILTVSAQAGNAMTAQGNAMSGPSAQAAAPTPIQGTIVSIEGSTLVLAAADGSSSRVVLESDTGIFGREPSTLDSIKPGEAMGVTATRADDGSLTATIINVFTPQIWQKARKGQWDMGPPGLVMTNEQVERVAAGVTGGTLYMKYEMLTAAIAVPTSAEIWRLVPIKLSDLKQGMKVSVRFAPGMKAAMVSTDLKG
jgi:hypothetical protein